MNLLEHLLGKRIRIEHSGIFTESDLNAVLAVPHDDPIWRAVHQLIDVAEDNANENAAASVNHPGECAGYVGGASHLRMLREELHTRRALGIDQLGRRVSEVT